MKVIVVYESLWGNTAAILTMHQITLFLTVLSTAVTLYLVLSRK